MSGFCPVCGEVIAGGEHACAADAPFWGRPAAPIPLGATPGRYAAVIQPLAQPQRPLAKRRRRER